MRVFWPKSGLDRNHGKIVGWRLKDTFCVVGIVDEWLQCSNSSSESDLDPLQGGIASLQALGYALIATIKDSPYYPNTGLVFWLNNYNIPVSCSKAVQIILYTPPDSTRLRFLCATPPYKAKRNEESAIQDHYGINSKVELGEDTLAEVVKLINISKVVQRQLLELSKDVSHTTQSTDTTIRSPVAGEGGVIRHTLVMALLPLQIYAQTLLAIFNYATPLGTPGDLSSTVDQCSLRLSQGLQGPERFKSTREVGLDVQLRSERYIRFWNTVWLIFNDVILGYSARQIILLNSVLIHKVITYGFSKYVIELPILTLKWLNDWPVGLKLNTPLSQFFCTGLGLVIQKWGDIVIPQLDVLLPILVQIFAFSSIAGITFTLSLVKDTINIFTSHFYLCHIVMKYVFNWQLESLGGLWNLFRGKRWNVLRKRTDSYEYDVDQLFLGTLLFTVSAFLFPTVLTYFGLFAFIRLIIVSLQQLIAACVAALNSFPLFELMLRFKEPSRLPAGIHIKRRHMKASDLKDNGAGRVSITHILELKNSPKSLSEILFSSS